MIVGNWQKKNEKKKNKMGWDNRLFDMNGRGVTMLAATLDLALKQDWGNMQSPERTIKGWRSTEEHGILLSTYLGTYGTKNPWNKFPDDGITLEAAAEFVINRLEHPSLANVPFHRWEDDCDHDGDNSIGWRAYVGEWGRVDNDYSAFIAVKKVFLWHGK